MPLIEEPSTDFHYINKMEDEFELPSFYLLQIRLPET